MRHIVIFLVSFLFISTAQAADSYSVGAGASVTIAEHSVCHVVTNGLSQALFVPTKSAAEWTSFRTNTPPGVTSVACDTTPNAFTFADVTGANPGTLTTATSITISGINTGAPVSVSGTGATISINGGSWVTSGMITNGQSLRVRLTSSASFSTAMSATVNVGGVTDGWSVTTRAAANCSNTTMRWTNASSGPCQAASGSMTHGQSKSVTNTASGYAGTRNLSCSDGTISQSGGSCAIDSVPSGCPNIGNTCSDGSKFAGSGMYVTDVNQGTVQWASVSQSNSGSQSLTNGKANQAWIVANRTLSQYPAFQLCENLVRHGKSDWYLPSRSELNTLYLNRTAIFGSPYTTIHWSSSEVDATNAWYQRMNNGSTDDAAKSYTRAIRCVRKP